MENILGEFFKQSLLVGGLALVVTILWKSTQEMTKKIIELTGRCIEVIQNNTATLKHLEDLQDKREQENQKYWQTRIAQQDKLLENIFDKIVDLDKYLHIEKEKPT